MRIEIVVLDGPKITDREMQYLDDVSGIQWLHLIGSNITDAGLAHVKHLKQLEILDLTYTHITDAGLVHVKDLPQLQQLFLSFTQVSEAGLEKNLKGFTSLHWLSFDGIKITPAGRERLEALLPQFSDKPPMDSAANPASAGQRDHPKSIPPTREGR